MFYFVFGRFLVFLKNWFCLLVKGFLEVGFLFVYFYLIFWFSFFILEIFENVFYVGFIFVLWLDMVYGIFEFMLKILGSCYFYKFGYVICVMVDVNKLYLGMFFNFVGLCKFWGFYKNCYIVWFEEVFFKIKDFKGGFFCFWKLFVFLNCMM